MDMGYEYDTARLTQVRACVMVVPRVVMVSHASITPRMHIRAITGAARSLKQIIAPLLKKHECMVYSWSQKPAPSNPIQTTVGLVK